MNSLQGKVALVTGTSKGIGAVIARELATRVVAVAVNDSGWINGQTIYAAGGFTR